MTAILLFASAAAFAQAPAADWSPRTGDAWVDRVLGDVNDYGNRYRDAFVDEMVRYYGAPREYVIDLLVAQHWAPGDVYYACAVAQLVGRSCRYVAEEWRREPGEGWGALAQRLGITPGSESSLRLKAGFAPSYERWSRPLPADRGDGASKARPNGRPGKARARVKA